MKTFLWRFVPPVLRPYLHRIESSPLGVRLARGTFWSFVGSVAQRGLALVASIFVARVLGKVGFGELGIVQGTVMMFSVLAGFGLGMTGTKYVAEFRRKDPAKAGRTIALSRGVAWVTGACMMVGLMALAPVLAERTLAARHLSPLLRLAAITLLFSSINGAQMGALTGFEAFKTISQVNVWSGLVTFGLTVAGAYWGGIKGAVGGLVAAQAITCVIGGRALRRTAAGAQVPVSFRGCLQESGVLWKFSLPSVLTGLLVWPVNWICSAVLVNQPNGYGEMGLFNAANQTRTLLLFVPNLLVGTLFPILTSLHAENDRRRFKKVLWSLQALNCGAVLVLALAAAALAPLIMRLYGAEFAKGADSLILLAFCAVPIAFTNGATQAFASTGRMWLCVLFVTGWALLTLVLTLVLVPRSLALGLALVNLISNSVNAASQALFFVGNR